MRWLLPEYFEDILPEEAARIEQERRDLAEKLKSVEKMASAVEPKTADLAAREEKIERLQEEIAAGIGFRVESHRHHILGRCRRCASKPARA